MALQSLCMTMVDMMHNHSKMVAKKRFSGPAVLVATLGYKNRLTNRQGDALLRNMHGFDTVTFISSQIC